ncbi:MAG TPA: hypothetical protein VHW26_12760 [Solirubrobacteraceae bacterium]|jgi:hypothetical protein|nr:hypothetical protein [Solirubrobacteraceae bacterium]
MSRERRGAAVTRAAVLATAAGLVGGCGSSQAPPAISAGAASQMTSHLREVRTAAADHDRAGATKELDAFAADVARQRAAGHLTAATYAALETGIGRARTRIGVEVSAPAPVATTTPAVAAPAGTTTVAVTPTPVVGVVRVGPVGPVGPGKGHAPGGGGKAKGHGPGGPGFDFGKAGKHGGGHGGG